MKTHTHTHKIKPNQIIFAENAVVIVAALDVSRVDVVALHTTTRGPRVLHTAAITVKSVWTGESTATTGYSRATSVNVNEREEAARAAPPLHPLFGIP